MRSQCILPLFLISVSQAIPQYKHHTLKARYDAVLTDDMILPSDGDNLEEIAYTGNESNDFFDSTMLDQSSLPSSGSNGDGDIIGESNLYGGELVDLEDKAAKKGKVVGGGRLSLPKPLTRRPSGQILNPNSSSSLNQSPSQTVPPDGSTESPDNGVPIEHSNEPYFQQKAVCDPPPGTQCDIIVQQNGLSFPAHQEFSNQLQKWIVCPNDRKSTQVGCVDSPNSGAGDSQGQPSSGYSEQQPQPGIQNQPPGQPGRSGQPGSRGQPSRNPGNPPQ